MVVALRWSQQKKDKKVETRNLTQGIYILLFNYLVVDLIGFIENAQLRQHYARLGRVHGEEKLTRDCGRPDRNSTMK